MARGPGADRQSQLQHPGIPHPGIPASLHPCILVYCMHAVHVANRSSSQSFRLEYLFDAPGKMQKKGTRKSSKVNCWTVSHILRFIFAAASGYSLPFKKKKYGTTADRSTRQTGYKVCQGNFSIVLGCK